MDLVGVAGLYELPYRRSQFHEGVSQRRDLAHPASTHEAERPSLLFRLGLGFSSARLSQAVSAFSVLLLAGDETFVLQHL
ncbi:MAG: hypothetical protein BWY79_01978 [Actinobacteria bacterium ADurb.Bin444]|nr:MAG: hypothetical protein BWY79_01978 [Actinobacteria bacterium ADurb.Bin444]